MSIHSEKVTPADLRSLIARKRVPIYVIAPAIPLHPSRLSLVLNERIPLDPDLAVRIQRAIEIVSVDRVGAHVG